VNADSPSEPSPDLVLLGARGSGKSTVGRLVAERTGRRFVDCDDLVRSRFPSEDAAAGISAIWARHGEAAWRRAESATCSRLFGPHIDPSAHTPRVVALGGGTPLLDHPAAVLDRARMGGRIRTVLLRARAETLHERLAAAPGDRPALVSDAPSLLEEIRTILARRAARYAALADVIVDVDGLNPEAVTDRVTTAAD